MRTGEQVLQYLTQNLKWDLRNAQAVVRGADLLPGGMFPFLEDRRNGKTYIIHLQRVSQDQYQYVPVEKPDGRHPS